MREEEFSLQDKARFIEELKGMEAWKVIEEYQEQKKEVVQTLMKSNPDEQLPRIVGRLHEIDEFNNYLEGIVRDAKNDGKKEKVILDKEEGDGYTHPEGIIT